MALACSELQQFYYFAPYLIIQHGTASSRFRYGNEYSVSMKRVPCGPCLIHEEENIDTDMTDLP